MANAKCGCSLQGDVVSYPVEDVGLTNQTNQDVVMRNTTRWAVMDVKQGDERGKINE